MLHKPFVMAALLAASCGAQAASDADLAAIRSQIDEMKKTYEQRIAALEKKLAQAELDAQAKPAAQAEARSAAPDKPAPGPVVAAAPTSASAFNPEVSLILQGQYVNTKDVPNRTITGFWPNQLDNLRGFSINETELVIGGGIDPYWRGRAIFAVNDDEVGVEEAWFQSSAIGHGIGVKGGRYRSGIGYLNEQHPHQWDFANAPLMYHRDVRPRGLLPGGRGAAQVAGADAVVPGVRCRSRARRKLPGNRPQQEWRRGLGLVCSPRR